MARELSIVSNKILLWRLGPLKFAKQEMWSRAPESKGMWAFPWPYYDSSFTYHQYTRLLPKRLQYVEYDDANIPFDTSRIFYIGCEKSIINYGKGIRLPMGVDHSELLNERGFLHRDYYIEDSFFDERDEWIKNVGKRVLPLNKFWYSGIFYTHLMPHKDRSVVDFDYDYEVDSELRY